MEDGSDITYAVDELTNRYETVDGNSLDYDAAGNLTVDKDGYNYEYDYENRIARIYRIDGANEVDVVKYNYDSLGRRINKEDCIADTNTLYYYSNKWQVLAEYDKNQSWSKTFVWGNYIDELLVRNASGIGIHNYIHDHLYSPVAMLNFVMGTVLERYEYDAYGNPTIMDASYNVRTSSNYGNNYLFTGRSVDILDSGSLKIQHNRNRDLDYYTGRWLSHDTLGYVDGLSLYEYVKSNPIMYLDYLGNKVLKNDCERVIDKIRKVSKKAKDILEELERLEKLRDPSKRSQCACQIPKISCRSCKEDPSCAKNNWGGYTQGGCPPPIVICYERINNSSEMITIITHELIHVYDKCRWEAPLFDCKKRACSEIRAYDISGFCNKFKGIPYKECIKKKAADSMKNLPLDRACQDKRKEVIEEVFDECFSDKNPIKPPQPKPEITKR